MQRLENSSNTEKKRDGCIFFVGILIILILICIGIQIRKHAPINNQEENVSERIEDDNPQADIQDSEKIEIELRKDFYHTYVDDEKTQSVMENITKLTEEDFASAINWIENCQLPYDDGHAVILAHNDTYDIIVYGYESKVVGPRGIVIKYDGVYSYFDYPWDRLHGSKEIYEKDFDHDNINELCFISGGAGTGISVEELIIFEKEGKDDALIDFEFEAATQYEENRQTFGFPDR